MQFFIKSPAFALVFSEVYAALKCNNILVFWSVEASPVMLPVGESLLFFQQFLNFWQVLKRVMGVSEIVYSSVCHENYCEDRALSECPHQRISQPFPKR